MKLVFQLLKRKKAAVAVILAAVIVLFAVAAALIIVSAPPYPPPDNISDNVSAKKEIAYTELQARLRLILFDYNLSAQRLVETVSSVNGKLEYTLTISDVPNSNVRSLESAVFNLFNLNYLHTEIFSNRIRGENSQFIINVLLIPMAEEIPDNGTVITPPVKDVYPFGVPFPPKGRGTIALLIDDAGANLVLANRLSKLDIPLTFAIIPHTPYAKETAELVRARGKGVFLHFPMQPDDYPNIDPGEGAVLMDMPQALVEAVTDSNVANIGVIDGANNHMGSRVTADAEKIRQVLTALSKHTDTFVDSKTSPNTAAYRVCREMGMKCAQNQRFLDNESDRAYIAKKLYEALIAAGKEEPMIVIGHLRPDTVEVLETVIPELQKLGYGFISVSDLTK
jgi:polysaccharide deacetylase 2 family uncharacterized protein YibQ